MTTPILNVQNLSKRFGGVIATDNVNMQIQRGEIHALIGPNGAGKTTLIAQLSGMLPPDTGKIIFNGRDITGLPAHEFSRAGLARSFQITSVFQQLSLLDNVALAVQARSGHGFRFFRNARKDKRLREPAAGYLEQVGLRDRIHWLASEVSHGERRQLELAMALATEPEMLLLDEPMAGMGQEESTQIIEILHGLSKRKTMLLVEHDMDAVFALADTISVLVYGTIIASGPPDFIRNDEQVRQAYLGEEAV
jgi:branched-chain amino acid transport system ATP-binding protein